MHKVMMFSRGLHAYHRLQLLAPASCPQQPKQIKTALQQVQRLHMAPWITHHFWRHPLLVPGRLHQICNYVAILRVPEFRDKSHWLWARC